MMMIFSCEKIYSVRNISRSQRAGHTRRADGGEGSVLVGGAAAAAVCHLQDVADDGLFVHRGTRRHRRRGG